MGAILEEIERRRRTSMIDAAHELGTPPTNIRGHLEALSDRVLPFSAETFDLPHPAAALTPIPHRSFFT